MTTDKKPDVNATIQLDQIDNIDDIKLPESRPRMPGAADDSGSMRPRQPTLPPPLPPEEAAKAFAPRTSQAPVSGAGRGSAAPAKAGGPPVVLVILFVLLLGGAIYGGLRVGGIVGGAASSASTKASAPPSTAVAATTSAPPASSVPAPTRTISIPEVN